MLGYIIKLNQLISLILGHLLKYDKSQRQFLLQPRLVAYCTAYKCIIKMEFIHLYNNKGTLSMLLIVRLKVLIAFVA